MRRVIAYEDGRPIWSDNEPSYARVDSYRGSLVTGEPGVIERSRLRKLIRGKEFDDKSTHPDRRESAL